MFGISYWHVDCFSFSINNISKHWIKQIFKRFTLLAITFLRFDLNISFGNLFLNIERVFRIFWFKIISSAPVSCAFPDYGSLCIFLSTERKEILVWLTLFLFLQMFQTQCLILPSASLWEKWENLLFGESSNASSIFSDMETIFHTQDKLLLLLALFPLRSVLWLCVYSD